MSNWCPRSTWAGMADSLVGAARNFPLTVPELLEIRVSEAPRRPICHHRDEQGRWHPVSGEKLLGDVLEFARRLAGLGLRTGDRLAIRAATSREWMMAELAGLRLGAVVVGVDPHATDEAAAQVLADSGTAMLLVDDRNMIPAGASDSRVTLTFADLRRQGRRASLPKPPRAVDPATLIYTSGTTGKPKGILYTHGQLLAASRAIVSTYSSLGPGDVLLAWLPMAHLFQRMMNLVALRVGARIYFCEDPREIMDRIKEVRPTVFVGVPRFYEKLQEGVRARIENFSRPARRLMEAALDSGRKRLEARLGSERRPAFTRLCSAILDGLVLRRIRAVMGGRIRYLITGSAPTPRGVLEFFHALGLPLLEAYGLSENVVPMAVNRPKDFRLGSVGRPLRENKLCFARNHELLVRGPGVFGGYWNQARKDGDLTADGFYRTGDFGYMDEDGFLYLRGRKSDLIKTSSGRRISSAKVEMVYSRIPEVEHFVVAGHGRKYLSALVTLQPGRLDGSSPTMLRASICQQMRRLEEELASHERIQSFAVLPGRFSIAGGELTGKLTLRRAHIHEKYADVIDELHAGEKPPRPNSQELVNA